MKVTDPNEINMIYHAYICHVIFLRQFMKFDLSFI